jgi:choline dehydrogenase
MKNKSPTTYDVIVVGAGSAGCVLAARLSEDANRSVLLLEAGPDYPDLSTLPEDIKSSYGAAYSHDWGYRARLTHLHRTIAVPRGKLTGGCSATNATFALRGAPADYDEWASLGNTGWSYEEVLPFFCKLEHDYDFTNKWHGQSGPLPIRRYTPKELTASQAAFLESCSKAGFPEAPDLNAPNAIGVGTSPMNSINGVRQSTALTYLASARHRQNFTLKTQAAVDRVIFSGKRATGVALANAQEIFGDRVVLAGGSYASPAILMRSGIGSATHLEMLGVKVVENLGGVGENLVDHPFLALVFAAPPLKQDLDVPFFQTALTLKSAAAGPGHDLQMLAGSVYPSEQSPTGAMLMLFVSVVKPHSRGRLRLRSKDPNAAPNIDLGYFKNPDDMPRMIEVLRVARRLAKTSPLARLTDVELSPGTEVLDADADLEAAIRAGVDTYHHPIGTCRMGAATDNKAVVDSHGNVHGIENLSVIDASIMPTIPAANTNLPTIMMAERCADWLIAGVTPRDPGSTRTEPEKVEM